MPSFAEMWLWVIPIWLAKKPLRRINKTWFKIIFHECEVDSATQHKQWHWKCLCSLQAFDISKHNGAETMLKGGTFSCYVTLHQLPFGYRATWYFTPPLGATLLRPQTFRLIPSTRGTACQLVGAQGQRQTRDRSSFVQSLQRQQSQQAEGPQLTTLLLHQSSL